MKITKFLVKEVLNFLNDTFGNEELVEGLYYDEDTLDGGDLVDFYIYYNLQHQLYLDTNVNYDAGMTKIVLYPHHKNYVIKIPCTGLYKKENKNVDPTLSAEAIENIIDEEIAFYDNLIEFSDEETAAMLSQILVPNYFICNYGKVPIYIQPIVRHYLRNECSNIHSDIIDNITEGDPSFNYKWIDSLIQNYGIRKTSYIVDFLKSEITDLHSGNYGYINDVGVIFDYGGYSSDMWDWF